MYNYFQNKENEAMGNRFYNASNDDFYNGDGYYSAIGDGQAMMQGAEISQPYIISVANSTSSNVTANIFNSNQNLLPTSTNFGNAAAVTITMQNGNLTYGMFLGQIREKPFRISQIYQVSTTTAQVTQALAFTTFDTFGASTN